MKRAWEVTAFVAACALMLWATGMWAPLKQEGRRVAERVVHGDPLTRETVTHKAGFAPGEGGAVTVTGGGMEVSMATKTQVYDTGATVSGILAVRNQDTSPLLISAATKQARISTPGGGITIEDISTTWGDYSEWDPAPSPPAGTELIFIVILGTPAIGVIADRHFYVYFTDESPTPWDIELQYNLSVTGQRLEREESLSYGTGRHGKPVYAKERTLSDSFQGIRPASWAGSITSEHGSISDSGTQVWEDPDWVPTCDPITSVSICFLMHKGADATRYADATVEWAEHPVDFSGGHKDFGGIYRIDGDGSELACSVPGTGGVSNANHTVTVNRPLIVDLSEMYVRDRLGATAKYDALRLDGPFVATPRYPASLGWSTTP